MNDTNQRLSGYTRFGVLLVIIGLLLAMDSFFKLSLVHKLWPVLITIVGGGFIGIFRLRYRKESLYIGMGIYFIGFSALALYCNFTTWTALSALWPVFVGILGLSLIGAFLFGRRHRMHLLLGLLLVSLSLVFFFVFAIDKGLWWTAFIFTGISILIAELSK